MKKISEYTYMNFEYENISKRIQNRLIYNACDLCPRECGVNRFEKTGACFTTADLKVARAALHMWEEPCISGVRGSGTIFFSGCQLQCVYCQNYKISKGETGSIITRERLLELFYELMEQGANNINLVTADPYLPDVIWAMEQAKIKGFSLPFVYNTGSYMKEDAVKALDGLVDIYLPDYKYYDEETAKRYSFASDYMEVAARAIEIMHEQQPECLFDEAGIMKKGVIVRHLLLPGKLLSAKRIVKMLYETYGDSIYLSLMGQYTPVNQIGDRYFELGDKVKKKSYRKLVDYAVSLGITNAFYQTGDVASESFIPDFDAGII